MEQKGEYHLIDFQVYAKAADGKTKNDHFQEMLVRAVAGRQIQAKTVLFDSWYASWKNLKLVHRLKLISYTTLKSNRLVSLGEEERCVHSKRSSGRRSSLSTVFWSSSRRFRSRWAVQGSGYKRRH